MSGHNPRLDGRQSDHGFGLTCLRRSARRCSLPNDIDEAEIFVFYKSVQRWLGTTIGRRRQIRFLTRQTVES
jgi:hypothetical protein